MASIGRLKIRRIYQMVSRLLKLLAFYTLLEACTFPILSERPQSNNFAPIVLPIEVCNGLTNQRISLVQGITQGIIIGAQVLLPLHMPKDGTQFSGIENSRENVGLHTIFDITSFQASLENIYSEYWCARPDMPQSKLWCQPQRQYEPTLRSREAWHMVMNVTRSHSSSNFRKLENLRHPDRSSAFGPDLFHYFARSSSGWGVLDRGCTMFSPEVRESGHAWDLYWAVDSALKFSSNVVEQARMVETAIGPDTVVKSPSVTSMGLGSRSVARGLDVVLHLRIEPDWQLHCQSWSNLRDGVHRDNCLNNSHVVHNTLIAEGVLPLSNVYVSSGLSARQLTDPKLGLEGLFETFNIFTKDSVLGERAIQLPRGREWWAAVEESLALSSKLFVGNSVSTFSAYVLQVRKRRGVPGWHYNGGAIPLSEAGILAFNESGAVETFPKRLKWVFNIHLGSSEMSKSFLNMLRVAVLSAQRNTNLIPVCVTTGGLPSQLLRWLHSEGVRVIRHKPSWAEIIEKAVAKHMENSRSKGLTGVEKSHLFGDPAAMIGTFMRIDIPMLGFVDEFILYTDVDVMFTGPVTWKNILPQPSIYDQAVRTNNYPRGLFNFGKSNTLSVPTYFSVSSESKHLDTNLMNAGVMLMNMRNLRETYNSFLEFITKRALSTGDLSWDTGPGDQGAYKEFYATMAGGEKNGVEAALLPLELNWKSYWEANPNASIVHFHGPKCESDIAPYFREGVVRVPLFEHLLRLCAIAGNCRDYCEQSESYLANI